MFHASRPCTFRLAPCEIFQHVGDLDAMTVAAVLNCRSHRRVIPRGNGQERRTVPPTRHGESLHLTQCGSPQSWAHHDCQKHPNGYRRAHADLTSFTTGSFGKPRTISPTMFFWICDDPA